MSGALSYSITAVVPHGTSLADQETLLLDLARHRPGLVFHDLLRTAEGDVPVRVEGGRIVRLSPADAPPHIGKNATRCAREMMEDFVDIGDVLLPGWGPHDATFELSIQDEPRVVADLEDMAHAVADAIGDVEDEGADGDPEYLAFLKELAAALEIARSEKLPLVASW